MTTADDDNSSVEFQYIEDDFNAASWLSKFPTRRKWFVIMLLFPMVSSTIMVLTATDQSIGLWLQLWMIFFIGLPLGILVTLAAACPLYAKRLHKNYPLVHLPTRLTLRPEGLRFQTARGESNLLWKDFIRWRTNNKTVLLYPAPRLFLIIPARLATLGFPIADLKAALTREIGPPRR
jgi:hypothetical protein